VRYPQYIPQFVRRYEVRSPLFALRDPCLSAQVLAAFGGAQKRLVAQPAAPARREGKA
jgi:hypothetical protein